MIFFQWLIAFLIMVVAAFIGTAFVSLTQPNPTGSALTYVICGFFAGIFAHAIGCFEKQE